MAETDKIPEKLIAVLQTWSAITDLIFNVAHMRYFQKKFFREKESVVLKGEYLTQARAYERKVDELLETLWPGQAKQSDLFKK